jgi:hypothetical protein
MDTSMGLVEGRHDAERCVAGGAIGDARTSLATSDAAIGRVERYVDRAVVSGHCDAVVDGNGRRAGLQL